MIGGVIMGFPERLKAAREKLGLKQNEAAKKVGIKNNTLSSYESGARQPDYDTLTKLAELYDVSINYLITGKERNDENLYFFDKTGLTEEELEDIIRHIEFVKWKSKQEGNKDE
jgi:transcriptional regulator with XRE-family HTH domain